MTRVLYLAAGNPINPGVGMDLVVSEHVKELANADDLDISVIAVAPGIAHQGSPGFYKVGRLPVQVYVGDLLNESPSIGRLLSKIGFVLSRSVPVMAYSFKSRSASEQIHQLLEGRQFDVVVIDHFYALSNIKLKDLLRSGARVIYISHDAMLPHIAEMATAKRTLFSKLYYLLEATRTHFVERRLFKMAAKVVHLSEYERRQVKCNPAKHIALLPPVSGIANVKVEQTSHSQMAQSVVFIGSPNHPPNAHAIKWIVDQLAPALAQQAPHIEIAILGGGTENIQAPSGNVKGYGYVSTADMRQALNTCICAISPVVLGRGIKVKVLDAIAAGCPVLATEQSLRGFERFDLPVGISDGRPDQLASAIFQLAESQTQRMASRVHMSQLWSDFLAERSGQLAQTIRSVLC